MVTLIFAVTVEALWFRNNSFNGGTEGAQIANPELFGLDLGIGIGERYPRPAFGILCLVVLVATAGGVAALRTSRLGSAMLAVRANERSAASAGISVVRIKLIGFAIGAFIAGLGGTLLAYKQTNVTFQTFSVFFGLTLFSTAYLAGITSVSGGVMAGLIAAGGIFFLVLDRAIDIGPWYAILSGLGVVLTVILNPEGIVGPAHEALDRRRQTRLRLAADGAAPDEVDAAASTAVERHSLAPGREHVGTGDVVGGGVAGGDALSVTNLSVVYGGVTAVCHVSFSVRPGSITGLIGPNGAGKTTTMDAICGFTSCEGQVQVEGRDVSRLAPHRRVEAGLGRTFQGLDLYEDLTVEENVVVGQYVAGSAASAEHLDAVLGVVDLLSDRERNVGELSQGRRQLVSIARALAGRPSVLLLDEPAAGLDSSESEWLADRLRAVRDAGVTILLVDHDVNLVLGLCDEIHVLDFGALIASGPPEAIRNDVAVNQAYLGTSHGREEAPAPPLPVRPTPHQGVPS